MRITLVTPEYAPDAALGGVATHTRLSGRALAALGHDVTVVARSATPGRTVEDGLTVVRVRPHFVPWRPAHILLHRLRVALAVRRSRPDVAHAAEWEAEALLVPFVARVPLVTRLATPTHVVNELNGRLGGHLVPWMERRQARASAVVYGPTHALSDRVAAEWDLDVRPPVPNPVDVAAVQAVGREDPRIDLPDRFVAFLGRLERRKGIEELGSALARVLAAEPDLHAVLVGRDAGVEGGDVMATFHARTSAIADRIHVLGELDRMAALAVVARAELFVMPSRWESFGFTCVEALALGRPVVVSAAGGLGEIMAGGRGGVTVPPGDADALTEAIRALVADPGRRARLGDEARVRAEDFDVASIVPQVVRLLEDAIGRHRSAVFDDGLYRRNYRAYFDPDARRDPFRRLYRDKLNAVSTTLRNEPQGRLLDVGGGFGRLASAVADHHDVVLVDLSETMLREARTRCGDRVALVQADARHLPFRCGAFPLVASLDLLCHVRDLDAGLGELARVAGPGGRVVFDTTSASPWWVLRYPSYVNWRPRRLVTTLRRSGVLPEWSSIVRHHHAAEVRSAIARHPLRLERRQNIGMRWAPKYHLWSTRRAG